MRIQILGIYLVSLLAGCAAPDRHASSPPAATNGPGYFVVILSPGPAWDSSKGRDEQIGIMEHRKYMASLVGGPMVLGGPFEDALGGMAILQSASPEDARRVIDRDPGVQRGLMKAEIHRWRVASIDPTSVTKGH